MGYCEKHWGASVSFDLAPFGVLSSTYTSPPMSWVLALDLNYIPDDKIRWVIGFEPYRAYRMSLAGDGLAVALGVGLRGGAHVKMSEPGATVWEVFALGSFGVLRSTEISLNGVETDIRPGSAVVAGSFLGYFNLLAGVQWTFSL